MVCRPPLTVIVFCIVGCPVIIMMAKKLTVSAGFCANGFLAFDFGDVDKIFLSGFFFGCEEIFSTNFVN